MPKITPDPLGTEPWDEFRENVARMTKAGEINEVWLALLRNPTIRPVHRLALVILATFSRTQLRPRSASRTAGTGSYSPKG